MEEAILWRTGEDCLESWAKRPAPWPHSGRTVGSGGPGRAVLTGTLAGAMDGDTVESLGSE